MALDGAAARRRRRPRRRRSCRPPAVWEASGHLANFTDPLVDCNELQGAVPPRQARRPRHLPELRHARTASPRPASSTSCSRPTPGPVEGAGARGVPAPRDGAGHVRQLQERARDVAQEAAVRHRPGRQVVPQRDHAGQLRVPHPRVRADGDGVLRAARREPAVVRVLVPGALRLVHRARHPGRPAAPAPPRRRRALALLVGHLRRGVPLPVGLGRARGHRQPRRLRPHRSTPSTRARSSSTSTRPPTSATCPT